MTLGVEFGYKIADLVRIQTRFNALKSFDHVITVTDFVRGDGSEYTSYSLGVAVPVWEDFHISLNYRNFND